MFLLKGLSVPVRHNCGKQKHRLLPGTVLPVSRTMWNGVTCLRVSVSQWFRYVWDVTGPGAGNTRDGASAWSAVEPKHHKLLCNARTTLLCDSKREYQTTRDKNVSCTVTVT